MLDAAARLFALRGVDAVSLRDIAASADVHLSLIRRYIGNRDKLVRAVFEHLSDNGQGVEPDTVMGQWVRVAGALVIAGRGLGQGKRRVQPGAGDGEDLEEGYGQDASAVRLRASQIVAAALGWVVLFEVPVDGGGCRPTSTARSPDTRSPWATPQAVAAGSSSRHIRESDCPRRCARVGPMHRRLPSRPR